jgi:hypothetical protein
MSRHVGWEFQLGGKTRSSTNASQSAAPSSSGAASAAASVASADSAASGTAASSAGTPAKAADSKDDSSARSDAKPPQDSKPTSSLVCHVCSIGEAAVSPGFLVDAHWLLALACRQRAPLPLRAVQEGCLLQVRACSCSCQVASPLLQSDLPARALAGAQSGLPPSQGCVRDVQVAKHSDFEALRLLEHGRCTVECFQNQDELAKSRDTSCRPASSVASGRLLGALLQLPPATRECEQLSKHAIHSTLALTACASSVSYASWPTWHALLQNATGTSSERCWSLGAQPYRPHEHSHAEQGRQHAGFENKRKAGSEKPASRTNFNTPNHSVEHGQLHRHEEKPNRLS